MSSFVHNMSSLSNMHFVAEKPPKNSQDFVLKRDLKDQMHERKMWEITDLQHQKSHGQYLARKMLAGLQLELVKM